MFVTLLDVARHTWTVVEAEGTIEPRAIVVEGRPAREELCFRPTSGPPELLANELTPHGYPVGGWAFHSRAAAKRQRRINEQRPFKEERPR